MPAKKVKKTPQTQVQNGGRAHKPIDWELVDKFLIAGCTGTEIAPHFNMHHQTFLDRVAKEKGMLFTDYAAEMFEKGNSILRNVQFEKALSGDNTMMVWLGKNRLKQRENPTELTVSNETVQSFKDIMNQVKAAQEAKKSEKEENSS